MVKEFINRALGSKLFLVPKTIADTTAASSSVRSTLWKRYYVTALVSAIVGAAVVGGRSALRHHVMELEKRATKAEEAPEYLLDNPHILNLYRPQLSLSECVMSAFAVHNETWNILSHGAGTLFFAGILVKRALRYLRTGKGMEFKTTNQSILLSFHALSYVLCFGISAIAHTFSAHSKAANDYLFKMDRGMITLPTGMTVLMCALIAFPRSGWERWLSSFLISVAALFCSYNVFIPDDPSKSSLVGSFVAVGLFSLWPVISQMRLLIRRGEYVFFGKFLFYFIASITPLLLSCVSFAKQFPERYFADKDWAQPLIDLGFNGHGLMHVLVAWHGLVAYRGMKMWNRERKYFL